MLFRDLIAGAHPEWVAPGAPWTVSEGPPSCEPESRTLTLSPECTPWILAHELAHAARSPVAPKRGLDVYDQCAEDARINGYLHRIGLRPGPAEWALCRKTLAPLWEHSVKDAFLVSLSLGADYIALRDAAPDRWRPLLTRLLAKVAEIMTPSYPDAIPEYKRSKALARVLRDVFEHPVTLGGALRTPKAIPPTYLVNPGDWTYEKWAKVPMRIVRPPLEGRLISSTRTVPREEGSMLSRPDRLLVDGRIFARRKRVSGGGTILFDSSASTSITPDVIQRTCETLPLGTVAYFGGAQDGTHGYLIIAAEKGRYCQKMPKIHHPYNVVDAAAVEWLATQPGPRTLVHDRGYTVPGHGSESSAPMALVDAIERRQIEAGIVRLSPSRHRGNK